jgi:lysophospholipase L1-like esterase
MRLQPKSRLLFIGDSITDCGRARPVGNIRTESGLGNGYVSLVNAALASGYPDFGIKVLNTGVSGNTVLDLQYRWQRDVLALEPDWLSLMIGINDVWGNFSLLGSFSSKITEDVFLDTLSELIQQVKPNLQGLVLMTPYYLETNRQDPLRSMMDRCGKVVEQVAEGNNAIFVNTQAHFDRVMECVDPLDLADDRVHVNLTGHMILARAFLEGIGFNWERKPGEDIDGN